MTWYRRVGLSAIAGVAMAAVATVVVAQDQVRPLPDSTRRRLLGCGTHAQVLQRRQATVEVKQALAKVSDCPEGPAVIAQLWVDVSGTDSNYVASLAGVSSIQQRPIADAMLQALGDRNRHITVRLRALGGFLAQLTSEYGSTFFFESSRKVRRDSQDRIVGYDSVREVNLARVSSNRSVPTRVDPALRAQIVATIARIASDSSEPEDLRIAAREVSAVLSRKSR